MENIDESILFKNLQDKTKPEIDESNKEEKIFKPKAIRYEKKLDEKILKYDIFIK